MQNQESFEESEDYYPSFALRPSQNASPQIKISHQKLFSSPILVAEFTDLPKGQNSSPDLYIEFTNSFNRILEKQKEEQEQNEQILDIMGNPIHQFDSPYDREDNSLVNPIQEDKQNGPPISSHLNTPLKIKRKEIRSPLQDITPSMTQKKKKTNTKLTISEKSRLLTPRTMQKSGLASSGFRRIERF